MKNKFRRASLFFFLLFASQSVLYAQVVLKNTCTNSTEPVLFNDAVNYFRIENWPGKSLMKLECSSCEIEFQDAGGIFKLTPSDNIVDTLKVFKDEQLLRFFVLSHQQTKKRDVHLSGGSNNQISRKHLNAKNELVIKTGKPGCKCIYTVTEFDIVSGGKKIHCKGVHLSSEAINQLLSLRPGSTFSIENAAYIESGENKTLAPITYTLKD